MFDKSSNFRIGGGSTFVDASRGRTGIDRLFDYAFAAAAYDSYVTESKASCLEGTRTQYIEDITAWATNLNDLTRRYRLLWMHGPAGVGKSAVAKSCAQKTGEGRKLGATFFFSRNNSIDDPARFFTTIAYQLATEIPEYKRIVGDKIESNFGVLEKGLEAQFRELIVAPFLELGDQDDSLSQKVVFIDGLDECNGDFAQSKIIELITTSITTYGNRIPLLWAFFSRPERHINDAFTRYAKFPQYWKLELPVSRDYDADIRLYFRDSLRPSSTLFDDIVRSPVAVVSWPSEEDLDTLVTMVAGLFIYAATVVKFILDPNALSPQRQLKDVLTFYSHLKASPANSNDHSAVTAELDAFYSMILSRISMKILPVVQKILLIVHTTGRVPVRVSANILGLSVQEFEGSLSRLHSVLALVPWEVGVVNTWISLATDGLPGSMEIRFYHASFMEFLLDQKRSMEFWIKSPRHYHTLALRGLVLSKEIYEMNGLSRDEKCRRLHKTLSACPIEDINPSICLEMRKELFYGYLTRDLFTWCAKADSSIELFNAVRGISNSVSFHHLFASGDSYAETALLNDMSKPYLHFQDCRERWGLPSPLKSEIEIHAISFGVDAPSAWKEAWAPLAAMITGGSSMSEPELKKVHRLLPGANNSGETGFSGVLNANKDGEILDFYAYFKSQVRQYFDEFIKGALGRAEKLDLDSLNETELLEYYSYEWASYKRVWANFKGFQAKRVIPRNIILSIRSPWHEFFTFIEGENHRLTECAGNLLGLFRCGEIVPIWLPRPTGAPVETQPRLLWAINDSWSHMLTHGSQSSRRLLHSRAKLFRVTEKYFRFDRAVILDDVQIPTLERVVQCLNNEYSGLSSLCGFPVPGNWSQVVMDMCWEILLLEHREEFSRILEELLLSGTSAHDRINLFRTFLRFSPNGTRAIFEEQAKSYLESTTSYAVPRSPENVNISSLDRHSVELASTLLDTKEQLRIKAEWIAGPKICDVVDREWDEFLAGHPMYRDTVDDYLAGEEGKVFRRLFDMPYDLVFEVDSEDPESKNSSLGGDEQTQAIHNYPDSIQQPSHIKVIVTNSASSTSPPSANEGKPDGDGNQSASESAPAVHTSSTRAQHTEKKSTKKGDKVVRFFRRTFKRS